MLGLITVLVDSLIPRIREIFELSYFQAGLVQFAFFIAYGLISIPAGKLLHQIGYKKGIITGIAIMGIGCSLFYPAASFRSFEVFLLGYFTLAAGMTILQVAINPYVTVLGDPETASSRLNLSQAFNSLGTAIAPILGATLILSDNIKNSEEIQNLSQEAKELYFTAEAAAVQSPFLFLSASLFLLAIIVLAVKLPQVLGTSQSSYKEALKDSKLKLGAIGIFVYVGAEVTIGSYLVNYFLDMNLAETIRNSEFMSGLASLVHSEGLDQIDNKGVVGAFVVFYWGGAMLGRFVGSYLTKVIRPNRVLAAFAASAIAFVSLSIVGGNLIAFWSILSVGLFNSIMFPTIFSIAIEDLGDLKPEGSGTLCTAIAGGAFLPPLYGFFTDISGFKTAFIMIIACYSYIWFYARKTTPKNS